MKNVLIGACIARLASVCCLRYLNLRHLKRHGASIPEEFAAAIDAEALAKTARYTAEQSTVAQIQSVYDSTLLLVFLFTPLLSFYDGWISSLSGSFVVRGVLFILLLALARSLLEVPFPLYITFRIEKRHGFNTTTPMLWITDFFKSTLVSAALLAILLAASLVLVKSSPLLWWFWVWGFFTLFSIAMTYLAPYLIEPLFSNFEPLGDPGLEDEIRHLLGKADLRVKGVMQMDASRRTLHSNAYFTGIGGGKRIVLYDTLVKQMERRELLAILAHEAGHWKKGHIWKRLAMTQGSALTLLYVVYLLIRWGGLPGLFGLTHGSFAAQITMVGFLASVASFPLTPFFSWLSRRHEWEADRFATELSGMPDALASALVKLSRENLANLHPSPLYASFYYSHPPVVARVAKLLGGLRADERGR